MLFRTRMGFAVGIVCVWCVQGSSCGVGCMSGGPGALYIRMALGSVIRWELTVGCLSGGHLTCTCSVGW